MVFKTQQKLNRGRKDKYEEGEGQKKNSKKKKKKKRDEKERGEIEKKREVIVPPNCEAFKI